MPIELSLADWIIIGLLALVVLLLVSIQLTVARIERRLASQSLAKERSAHVESQEGSESVFDQFLAEDPARLKLSKTEQFAAYREWKKERGLTWSS